VFSYDEEGRLTKIERDNGPSVETAYEYSYTGDGIRHMKKDYLAEKEYRYGCSIDCGGMPLRVYSRELGSQGEWSSVEDYLQVGNVLGYGSRWQVRYGAGSLLMAGNEPESLHMAYQDIFRNPIIPELIPCVLQVTQPASDIPCPPLLDDICAFNAVQTYGISLCEGESEGCGSSSGGGGPGTDWCEQNRRSPSAVNCQDCCDQKVIERIKGLPKDQCKKLKDCLKEKCQDTDPEGRIECFKGCLVEVLGTWKASPLILKIKRYLECCYTACLPDGRFGPPGHCKKFLPF
jgi:hypothetical protein